MRPKTNKEKTANARQVELLSNALTKAEQSQGYWLNAAGRTAPRIYGVGTQVSPFNTLILSLHAADNGYKTAQYSTFQQAKARGEGILSKERGVPFHWYSWDKYVNRNNPADVISRDDYQQLSDEQRQAYKGVQRRQIMTVFNLDQTSLPHANAGKYNKVVAETGRYEDRVHEKNEDAELHKQVNKFFDKMKTDLVPIRKSSQGLAYYDTRSDVIYLPNQKDFSSYNDYVQESLRQIIAATGHQQRLAREGAVKPLPNSFEGVLNDDSIKYERLVQEVASGVKMQEMGLPATLSPGSIALVDYWTRELNENPCMIDALEADVNAALTVVRKAEQGEKIEYATLRNNRRTEAERDKQRPHVDSREAAILTDIIAHGGMAINEANFQTANDKIAFLEKFGLGQFEADKNAALKHVNDTDPETVELAYTDAQSAAARIAERCSGYLSYEWREGGHYFIADQLATLPDKRTKEMVIVRDKESGITDVVLPSTAMSGGHVVLPSGDKRPYYLTPDEVMSEEERNAQGVKVVPNRAKAFRKDAIIAALVQQGAGYVRFFNKDGSLGYRPDDSYFKDKEVTVAKLNGKSLDVTSRVNVGEAVKMATSTVFEQIQMMRDDEGKWTLYLKPEGAAGYSVYPDKEDLNRFFATVKSDDKKGIGPLRQELAEKYNAMVANNPDLKVNIFGTAASAEDAERIERVNIFRTKDDKLMLLPQIKGEPKQYPREITQEQWQRLWLAEDRATYKTNLAAQIYADVLHKTVDQSETQQAEQQKEQQTENRAEKKQEEERQAREVAEDVKEEQTKQQKIREEAEKEREKEEAKAQAAAAAFITALKQFTDLKAKHPEAVLLFRDADRYVAYKEDADRCAKTLGLDKQQRVIPQTDERIDVVGFQYHNLDIYLPKLIRSGARVAICDQLEPMDKRRTSESKAERTPAMSSEEADSVKHQQRVTAVDKSSENNNETKEETATRGIHR